MIVIEPHKSILHLQILYTIVAGLALEFAVTTLIDGDAAVPIRMEVLPYFCANLVTLVPFFHGALRHLDVTYSGSAEGAPRPGAILADWSLLFIESCIFLAMAALLARPEAFTVALLALLAVDTLWGFAAHLAFSRQGIDLRAELKWARLNLVTIFLLVLTLVFLDSLTGSDRPVDTYHWILVVTITTARTVCDYWFSWEFYFGSDAR